MGSESEEKKEMLIINGNAFYEIDLECVKKKKQCAQTCLLYTSPSPRD